MARFLALRDVIMGGNVVVGEVAVLVVAGKCRPGEDSVTPFMLLSTPYV